jgi:proline iminopeptidase
MCQSLALDQVNGAEVFWKTKVNSTPMMLLALALLVSCAGDSGARIQAEEASVDGDGVVLRMRTVGPLDAAGTLIVLHGGPGLSLEAMDGYTSLAGPDRRVVSYDQRGAGQSSVPDDLDHRLEAHVADLEAIRVASRAERVQLLGQSWGGAIAAAYAATHPDRVSALVFVGAVPLDTEEYLAGQRRFQTRVRELQQLGIIDEVVPPIDEGSCTAAFASVLPAYLADPTADVSLDIASCTAQTARATYESFVTDETVQVYADQLSEFDSPALLVAGEDDLFGPDWLERHREILVGAPTDSVLIADAGHLVIAEQPDATLAAIAAFLDEHRDS